MPPLWRGRRLEHASFYRKCNTFSPTLGLSNLPKCKSRIAIGEGFREGFRVYPNPAQTEVTLSLPAFEGQASQLLLYNQVGQVVKQWRYDAAAAQETINVSGVEAGIYWIQVRNGRQIQSKRLMIANE